MDNSLGDIIRDQRKLKGWTIKQFIEKLELDLSPSYITKLERYSDIPSPKVLSKIAEVFGISKGPLIYLVKNLMMARVEKYIETRYRPLMYPNIHDLSIDKERYL